jgi:hypothetical protein
MRLLALPLLLALTAAAPDPSADPAQLSATVKDLASDAFEGRGPGTAGEDKTVAYLIERFKALGIEPGGENGSYVQRVPLIHTRIGAGTMSFGNTAATQGKEINVTTVHARERVSIAGLPMIFVGYGVHAPEAKWDDFKGVDLKGKVAVFLVNDPDFEATSADDANGRFGGKRMTYYGRWTYKFDEAARRGAAVALIVHDTGGAGYGWSTVNANNGENYDIVRGPDDPKIPLQGWIEHDSADALFKSAGLDLGALRVQARSAAFKPVELKGVPFSADLAVSVERIESRNVIAKLTGAKHPAETLMFGAHWDAYGKGSDGTIRPGANDDALGVAGVIELARLPPALSAGEDRGQSDARHPPDRGPGEECRAGRQGRLVARRRARHRRRRTGPDSGRRNLRRARALLPRRPFPGRTQGSPRAAADGARRPARPCRRRYRCGPEMARRLYALLPSGLRRLGRELEPQRRRGGRRPVLRDGEQDRQFAQMAAVAPGLRIRRRAREERGRAALKRRGT